MNNELSFNEVVSSEEKLREILGSPSELVTRKTISFLDQHCKEFISKSPFLLLATSNSSGSCDVSPRGDAAGFVQILDDYRLLIPERPGNRKMDSMLNIVSNPQVGMIFIIPGMEETLRINGRACIVKDQDLLKKSEMNGRVPVLGIGIEVEECFVHCAKAFKRSQLWQQESWLNREELPSAAKILADHVKVSGVTEESVAQALNESYTKRLY